MFSPPLRTRVPSLLWRVACLHHFGSHQGVMAARIFCRVVIQSIEIKAAGFSTARQSTQFRSRARLAIT
jgi:hypothetical protein